MPELPEVETVVRQIRPLVEGRTIAAVARASRLMVKPTRPAFVRSITGQPIERIDRQGKWMFFRLGSGSTLVIHLGMTGQLGVTDSKQPLAPHTHLTLRFADAPEGDELRFVDPRRFGELVYYDAPAFSARFGPQKLGPDALELTPERLLGIVSKTKRRIKVVLMDQRVVAGIGNIYADEILFDARIAPARPAETLDRAAVRRLCRSTAKVLRRAIEHQGTSIRDYVTAHGVPGEFQKLLRVYGRVGLPCSSCKAPIVRSAAVLPGRSSYFCPICQALPEIVENQTAPPVRSKTKAGKSGKSPDQSHSESHSGSKSADTWLDDGF